LFPDPLPARGSPLKRPTSGSVNDSDTVSQSPLYHAIGLASAVYCQFKVGEEALMKKERALKVVLVFVDYCLRVASSW
jgi:hypothetical protein